MRVRVRVMVRVRVRVRVTVRIRVRLEHLLPGRARHLLQQLLRGAHLLRARAGVRAGVSVTARVRLRFSEARTASGTSERWSRATWLGLGVRVGG